MQPQSSDSVRKLLSAGSDLAGGATGAAVGLLIGGPVGALAGGAAAPLLTYAFRSIATEVEQRVLAPREEVRVGAALAFAAETVRENLAQGKSPRTDEFFPTEELGRSSAQEILEGTLLAAQREHEEAKVRYYGRLVGNIAFRPDVSRARANALLRIAERLSYRQLVVLALCRDPADYRLRNYWYEQDREIEDEVWALLIEIYDLYLLRLVHSRKSGVLHPGQIWPSEMETWGVGETLYGLMELGSMPESDLENVALLLRKPDGANR